MTTAIPSTQRRLMARLVGAIYRIANGLFPVIDTIVRQPTCPWLQRARYADRFSGILQQLLGLTARLRPTTLSPNPSFRTLPQRPAQPATAPHPKQPGPKQPHPEQPGPIVPRRPARFLTARQLAQRLATLLSQLEQLAADIGAALPAILRRNVAQARALAGCNALPPPARPTWERAG